MSIEAALIALLSGIAGGRRHLSRAENISADQGGYLVLNRVSGQREYFTTGPSGYVVSRFQVDAYANTATEVVAVAAAVVQALSGYRGIAAGTRISATFVDGPRDLPASDAGEVNHLHRRSTDVLIHHDE